MRKDLPKAIVLTDAASSGLEMREVAKKCGFKVIGYQTQPLDFYKTLGQAYCPPYVNDTSYYDYIIVEPDLSFGLEKLKALPVEIEAVITGSEMGVTPTDTLASKLGLRCNDLALTAARRNKIEMKIAVDRAGLRIAKYKACRTQKDLDQFLKNTPFPVILKPPTGVGMYHFYLCHNREEAVRGLENIVGKDDSIASICECADVEEYIGGDEYAVDTFADGKDIIVTDIWKYRRIDFGTARNLYYDIFMEPIDDPNLTPLKEYAIGICKALGIRYGAAHPEIKIDGRGPVMMEVAARFAGCKMPHMCRDLSNFDPFTSTLETLCGKTITSKGPLKYKKLAWIAFCPVEEEGIIGSFEGLDEIMRLPSYHSHFLPYEIGQKISKTVDLYTNPLEVWLAHEDRDLLKNDAELAHNIFKIRCR